MPLTDRQSKAVLLSIFIVAACGLTYELIIGALSSYLFGNSITHFSIVIGLFLSAMGLGAFASRRIARHLLEWFVGLEIGLGLIGGASAALLFTVFATSPYYHLAMVGLILMIGGVIGAEIPLLTRMLGRERGLKDTLANVLAFDYLGALLASLLFPVVLLPQLGLLRTSFATGLLNLVAALGILWFFREQLEGSTRLAVAGGVMGIALISGAAWSEGLTSLLEKRLYEDEIIYARQSPYQRLVLTRWGDDLRMFLDGDIQFSSIDEHRYHELLVHPAMTLAASRESVLILGGGDGLALREVWKYPDVERVVLVDLDHYVTDLARTYAPLRALNGDSMHDPRLEIVNQDAFKYLEENAGAFGVILVDLPDPSNESLGKLYSSSFYKLASHNLGQGGVLASQATSPYFAREAFWCIVHTAEEVGFEIWPYHAYIPSFGDWGFFIASEIDLATAAFEPLVPTRFLSSEIFQASTVFDPDTAEVETQINTLDTQVILRYYERGWRQWD